MMRNLSILGAVLLLVGCSGTYYDCTGTARYNNGWEQKAHGRLEIYGIQPFMTHLDFRPDDDSFFPIMPNCSSFLQDYIQCGKDIGFARFDKVDGSLKISHAKSDRVYDLMCKKITPVY